MQRLRLHGAKGYQPLFARKAYQSIGNAFDTPRRHMLAEIGARCSQLGAQRCVTFGGRQKDKSIAVN